MIARRQKCRLFYAIIPSMMLQEITEQTELLKADGTLNAEGWARKPFWQYDRKKAGFRMAIEEWDCYTITDEEGRFSFRILFSELRCAGLFSIAFFDYIRGKSVEICSSKLLPKARTLSQNPRADSAVTFADSRMTIAFVKKGMKHQILITAPYLLLPDGSKGFKADIILKEKAEAESINTATRISDDGKFWRLTHRTGSMDAEGILFINHIAYKLNKHCYGMLDWTRGKWPARCSWNEVSITGYTESGIRWDITRYSSSESFILFDGKLNIAGSMTQEKEDSGLCRIASDDGKLAMAFSPLSSLQGSLSSKILSIRRDVARGCFTGFFTLDDGRRIDFKDAYGAISEIKARW